MAEKPAIDKSRTVVLATDLRSGIVGLRPEAEQKPSLDNAALILAAAGKAGAAFMHIAVRFKFDLPPARAKHPVSSPRVSRPIHSARLPRYGEHGIERSRLSS